MLAPATSALPARDALLDTVVQLELSTAPNWVAALARADVAAGCLLFGGAGGLAKTVLRLVNNVTFESGAEPDWGVLLTLLECVRAALLGPSSHMPPEARAKWDAKLSASESSIRAARLLAKYAFTVPPMVIQRSDAAALTVLLRETVTAAAAREKMRADAGEVGEEEAFAALWRDMRDVHAYGLHRGMPLAKVLEEFVRAALLAQAWPVAERCGPAPALLLRLGCGCAHDAGAACSAAYLSARAFVRSTSFLSFCRYPSRSAPGTLVTYGKQSTSHQC